MEKLDVFFRPTIESERSWADLYRANAAGTLATIKAEERHALARMRMHLSALAQVHVDERAQKEALKAGWCWRWRCKFERNSVTFPPPSNSKLE